MPSKPSDCRPPPVSSRAASSVEQVLRDADHWLGLHLTLHDLTGVFSIRGGGSRLDGARGSHRRFAVCRIGYCARCLQHCGEAIPRRCLADFEPFAATCWKGVTEVVVPLRRDGVLLAILFVGAWRRTPPPVHALPDGWRSAYRALPLFSGTEAARIGRVFLMLGNGLVQSSEQQALAHLPDNRQAQIMRFLHYHVHRDIALADLAAVLHLSPSRTSHLVTERFGTSFQELVIHHRMQRAMHFLRTTDLPAADVGRRVGIDNEYHFNRLFKRTHGLPPARYRRRFKSGPDENDAGV